MLHLPTTYLSKECNCNPKRNTSPDPRFRLIIWMSFPVYKDKMIAPRPCPGDASLQNPAISLQATQIKGDKVAACPMLLVGLALRQYQSTSAGKGALSERHPRHIRRASLALSFFGCSPLVRSRYLLQQNY